MASVNEAFVEDDDVREKSEQQNDSPIPVKKLADIFDVVIDYSAARKQPLFFAAISGKTTNSNSKNYFFFVLPIPLVA